MKKSKNSAVICMKIRKEKHVMNLQERKKESYKNERILSHHNQDEKEVSKHGHLMITKTNENLFRKVGRNISENKKILKYQNQKGKKRCQNKITFGDYEEMLREIKLRRKPRKTGKFYCL